MLCQPTAADAAAAAAGCAVLSAVCCPVRTRVCWLSFDGPVKLLRGVLAWYVQDSHRVQLQGPVGHPSLHDRVRDDAPQRCHGHCCLCARDCVQQDHVGEVDCCAAVCDVWGPQQGCQVDGMVWEAVDCLQDDIADCCCFQPCKTHGSRHSPGAQGVEGGKKR